MLAILSPAKKQNFESASPLDKYSTILCKHETNQLIDIMQGMTAANIAKLMSLSKNLADLNYQRYQDYDKSYYTKKNAKQAIYAFQGDVYIGLQAETLSAQDIEFAQNHLAILSGLYGVLRPLDRIQAHRLEMGTKLKNVKGANLYNFWQSKLTTTINTLLAASDSHILINLASNEYFKAIDQTQLDAEIIDIDFKEYKVDSYKTIGLFAKRARGMMANFMLKNRITTPAGLKKFNIDGYALNNELSTNNKLVFTRKKA